MRGLTERERIALTNAMPDRLVELDQGSDDDESMLATIDQAVALGWLEERDEGSKWAWTITRRGRVALEVDALVRSFS